MNKGLVYGVVSGTSKNPQVVYLEKPEKVTNALYALASPVHPTEIFKIAAPCISDKCKNWRADKSCNLAKHAATSDVSYDLLPACKIRKDCLWWEQEGKSACHRCKSWVTNTKQMTINHKLD